MKIIRLFYRQWIFLSVPILFLLLITTRCRNFDAKKRVVLEQHIDSLNLKLAENLKYDSLRFIELEKLLKVCDSIDYLKGTTEVAITGARICMLDFRNSRALELLNIANEAMLKSGDKRLEALVNLYYGLFNFRIQNWEAALDYYFKALQISLEARDSATYAKSQMNIGNLYLENGNLEKAYHYFHKSITFNKLIRDQDNLSLDYHRMSIYHLRKGEPDSARYYLETEIQTSKGSRNELLYIYNLNNLVGFYISNEDLVNAERYALKALRLTDSISSYVNPTAIESAIHANLGLIKYKKGSFNEALEYFNLAYSDSLYNIDLKYRMTLLYQLYLTNKQLSNHNRAYLSLEEYIAIRDKNDKTISEQNILDTEMRYNVEQIQKEHEHKQSQMKLLLYSSMVVFGLGILVLVLFIQKQRIKINNARLLKDLQELKLDKLNRELASQALFIAKNLERNKHLIQDLKDKLPVLKSENQNIASGVIRELSTEANDNAWKEFEMRFTEVHADFYKNLAMINPNLTYNEKRLCAFLLLDMSTKEISSITGQSIRAIEQARIRLRNHLNLTNKDVTLNAFLNSMR